MGVPLPFRRSEVIAVVLVLAAWVVLSIVLGLVVGAGIHRADTMELRVPRPAPRDEAAPAVPAAVAAPAVGPLPVPRVAADAEVRARIAA